MRRQYSGAIPLSEYERHAQLIQGAKQEKKEAEKLRDEARKDRNEAQVNPMTLGLWFYTVARPVMKLMKFFVHCTITADIF